ncbi:MAG: GIY-YIG nuclease family protein [Bilifractor sp.]|jgi:group I intron endonuclease
MIGVYMIVNNENGRRYIGQSRNIERRFNEHFSRKRRVHSNLFDDDIQKYGKSCFRLEVLRECDPSDLIKYERKYISELSPEYNSVEYGMKRDDDFCEKVSASVKEWWKHLDDEKRQKMLDQLTGPKVGHPVSEHTRELIREANLGKKQSPETRAKRSRSLKKRFSEIPRDVKAHFKPMYDIDTGETFESVKAAGAALGVKPSTISQALKKGHKVKGHRLGYLKV